MDDQADATGPSSNEPSEPEASGGTGSPSKLWPTLVGVAVGVLATLVVVLTVVLVTREDKTSTVSTETTESTETSTTTSTPVTTPPNGDLRGVAQRLDVLLQSSARTRGDVVEVVAKVGAGCELEPYAAGQAMYNSQQSRQQIISELSALQVTGNEQADKLVALLLAAVQNSQHANEHYLAWIEDDYARYYYDNTTYDPNTGQPTTNCPGTAPKTQDWNDAVAASADASTAKKAFVVAYNPVATQFGLRTWSETEF